MERPADPVDFARALQTEAQVLRHQFHDRLMKAFLDPAVYDGRVAVTARPPRERAAERWSAGLAEAKSPATGS
jgi:hypothetical protein